MPLRRIRLFARLFVAGALLAATVLGLVPPVVGRSVPRTDVSFRNLTLSELVPSRAGALRGPHGSVRLVRATWSRPGVACSESDFTMAGFTWRQEGEEEVEAELAWADSAAAVEGTGTTTEPMALLHAGPGDGPDPGSPDDSGIQGSSPVWTGRARCIGFRLKLPADQELSDLRAVFVDASDDGGGGTGVTAALTKAWSAVSGVWGFLAPRPAEALTTRPDIITRAEWGANEGLRRCGPYYADSLKAAYVHHTAGSNSYTRDQADNVVRAIHAFHVRGRGWCDIAYNFLIDRFGRIYEGRYGGMTRPLIGGHAAGFNTGTTGVAAMGEFTSVEPSRAMIQAFKELLAWRLDVAHLRPTGWTRLTSGGGGTSRYGAGDTVSLRVINGHRDTSFTACPGTRLYAKLGAIRRGAEALGLPKLYSPTRSRTALEPGASTVTYRASLSGDLDWFVDVLDGGGQLLRRMTGHGSQIAASWDGRADDGTEVAPGFYRVKMWARATEGPETRPAWLEAVACSAIGGKEDDLVTGTSGDDILCGVGGNDVLRGGGGADVLLGGPGFDTTDHSTAASGVAVNLGAGTSSGQGADTLSSIEAASGSPFADTLVGSHGNNRLAGSGGADRLVGSGGNDLLDGGEGSDSADYSGSGSRVVVDLENGTASGDGTDSLRSVENLVGSLFRDTLIGDAGPNALDGLKGSDTIRGRKGNDTLRGGQGDDVVTGGRGDDHLSGGGGADQLTGSAGMDQLAGDRGNDSLRCKDGQADGVDGGDGTDRADADKNLDILTSVERVIKPR